MRRNTHRGLYEHQKMSISYVISKLNSTQMPWMKQAILFGSCATGKNRFDSDIDILFVTDSNYKEYKNQMLELKRELIGLPDEYAEVDPKFMLNDYINTQKSTFLENIKNEGVILWTHSHI